MIEILIYIYLALLNVLYNIYTFEDYKLAAKNIYIYDILYTLVNIIGLTYYILISDYVLITILSVNIFYKISIMIYFYFKNKWIYEKVNETISYNNLNFIDNSIFNDEINSNQYINNDCIYLEDE